MSRAALFEDIDKTKYKRDNDDTQGREINQVYANFYMYEESTENAAKYTQEEWSKILSRGEEILKKIANDMDKGAASAVVQESIGEFRQHIDDNFYECTPDIFKTLGKEYCSNKSLISNVDKYKPGLAKFLGEAIQVYCDKL